MAVKTHLLSLINEGCALGRGALQLLKSINRRPREEDAENRKAKNMGLRVSVHHHPRDRGTLDDISARKDERKAQGAENDDFFVCAQSKSTLGQQLSRINIRHRFQVSHFVCIHVLFPINFLIST